MTYFHEKEYLIRRKVLKLFGGAFHVFNVQGDTVAYSEMKAFKLKEDLRLYTDEGMSQEIFHIQARQIIDFAATYDVYDSNSQTKIGALRRKGLKSIFKDKWVILDAGDQELGFIEEDSMFKAFVRRFLVNLIPQEYRCVVHGTEVLKYQQNFNPFVMKIRVIFGDTNTPFSRELAMAGGILLCAIEGKQS